MGVAYLVWNCFVTGYNCFFSWFEVFVDLFNKMQSIINKTKLTVFWNISRNYTPTSKQDSHAMNFPNHTRTHACTPTDNIKPSRINANLKSG